MNAKELFQHYGAKNTTTGCVILEKAGTVPGGYSRVWFDSKTYLAHRYVYADHHGDIPKGKVICHSCDNPACVNIDHLWIGTQADNIADKVAKGNQTRGSSVNTAKLNEDQVAHIKRRLMDGEKCVTLATEYGVKDVTISQIKTGRSWKHIKPHNPRA